MRPGVKVSLQPTLGFLISEAPRPQGGASLIAETFQSQRKCGFLKVQRDYYKAMQIVLQNTQAQEEDEDEEENMDLPELS